MIQPKIADRNYKLIILKRKQRGIPNISFHTVPIEFGQNTRANKIFSGAKNECLEVERILKAWQGISSCNNEIREYIKPYLEGIRQIALTKEILGKKKELKKEYARLLFIAQGINNSYDCSIVEVVEDFVNKKLYRKMKREHDLAQHNIRRNRKREVKIYYGI